MVIDSLATGASPSRVNCCCSVKLKPATVALFYTASRRLVTFGPLESESAPGFLESWGPAADWCTHLAVLAVLDILLPVQEPVWDLVLPRVLHDGHHTLHLVAKQGN